MRSSQLEPALDELLGRELLRTDFLGALVGRYSESLTGRDNGEGKRIASEIRRLEGQKQRILDTFFEGLIEKPDRDARLAKVETRLRDLRKRNLRPVPTLTVDSLVQLFQPFAEWAFLERDDKRRLLSLILPEIKVSNYHLHAFKVMLPIITQGTRTDRVNASNEALNLVVNIQLVA